MPASLRSASLAIQGLVSLPRTKYTFIETNMASQGLDYSQWLDAQNVCVIGAGTMGAGIAAHLANLGFKVSLLDVSREAAVEGLARARAAKPPHFYVSERAHEIEVAGIKDGAALLSEADWVCEAVVEKLDIKRNLFAEIEPQLKPGAMISTNTSGLQIGLLAEGRSEEFRAKFLGTHFFNPPRYLKLLELIPTDETEPAAVKAMTEFLEKRVARRVILAKDTPGFIANRFGMWSMYHAIHSAEKLYLTIEQVDAMTGPFLGRPRSGSFRLNDIVGLDIMADIARNLVERCPGDVHMSNFRTPRSMEALLAKGWIGDKVRQGYYRKEGKELLALNLQTFAYSQRQEPHLVAVDELSKLALGERLGQALDRRCEVGEFLRQHLVPVLKYADYLKEEISHSVRDFDRVMMWGFGWQMGPFAMMDAIGPERLGMSFEPFYEGTKQRSFSGGLVPTAPEPEYAALTDFPIVGETPSYFLRDLGDGVMAVSLRTKIGVITPQVVKDLTEFVFTGAHRPFVLTSEARSFSAGYDLNHFDALIQANDFEGIDQSLIELQQLGEALEKAECVAAVFGHALGAGLEIALSCSRIVALAEANIGLPEAKVGLLPGGRGTALMRVYNQHTAKRLAEVARNLTEGTISTSADHARSLGYLRQTDFTVYHPDRLITEAKRLAMNAGPTKRPAWHTPEGPIGGMIDREIEEGRRTGVFTDHDRTIGEKFRTIFARAQSYEDAIRLERVEFLDLCRKALSHARIKHMLENNKPLRN
jgi:3-hydroxyacyl-CoA dehydrogenase